MSDEVKMNDPAGIVKVGRPGKVFIVENHLSALQKEDMENAMPYSIHSSFSVFKIKHLENGKCIQANIPPKKLADIAEKTRIANEIVVKTRLGAGGTNKSGGEKTPDCYTLKFKFGDFKDKSPAQVLLEDPNNKNKLLANRDNLEKNAQSNPKFAAVNNALVNAIDDAIMRLDNDALKPLDTEAISTSSGQIPIYVEEVKIPNIKKIVEKQGKRVTYVYSVKIYCNPSMNTPYVVEMMNCYAPVAEGRNEVILKEAVETEHSKFVMNEAEWNDIVKEMIQIEDLFKTFNYKPIDTMSHDCRRQAMEEFRKNQTQ